MNNMYHVLAFHPDSEEEKIVPGNATSYLGAIDLKRIMEKQTNEFNFKLIKTDNVTESMRC